MRLNLGQIATYTDYLTVGIQVRDLGELDTLPVFRTRIEFYCGLATKHARSFAVLNTQVGRSK